MLPLRGNQGVEDRVVTMMDRVVGDHRLLPHVVKRAGDVHVWPLVALVGRYAGLHGVLGVRWHLYPVGEGHDPQRLPVDPPVERGCHLDLVNVLLERHGCSEEHGRVGGVDDADGHLVAIPMGGVYHRLEVAGNEPGHRRCRVPQELPVERGVPDAAVLGDYDRGGLVPAPVRPVLPGDRYGLEVDLRLAVLPGPPPQRRAPRPGPLGCPSPKRVCR